MAELEDANILAVIHEVERVKLGHMDANGVAYVPANASVLHARAIRVKSSAVQNVAINVGANVRC